MKQSVQQLKKVMRSEIRKKLKAMTLDAIAKESQIVMEKMQKTSTFINATHVCLFVPMPREINTTPLIYTALKQGKSCYVPVMDPKVVKMTMVKIKDVNDFESFQLNEWKIPEPPIESVPFRENVLDAKPKTPLLVVMPGLAFDKKGGRLGKGKGYYDRFLKELYKTYEDNKLPRPRTIGVALSIGMVDEVPMSETDVPIDDVIYP